jgi:hypothetical protein
VLACREDEASETGPPAQTADPWPPVDVPIGVQQYLVILISHMPHQANRYLPMGELAGASAHRCGRKCHAHWPPLP